MAFSWLDTLLPEELRVRCMAGRWQRSPQRRPLCPRRARGWMLLLARSLPEA